MNDSTPPRPGPATSGIAPRFVTGSILRHILVMTGTGAIGLMAIFVGDLADIYFLGKLGDVEVLAAVGYAGTIMFLSISVGIGLSIATTALVAPAIGAGDRDLAERMSTNGHLFAALVGAVVALLLWPLAGPILGWMGATGRTQSLASTYLRIVLPSLPFLAVGMASGAVLRSLGDARRAMHVTLAAAVVYIVLDPLFIFTFGLGLNGAALAAVLSRMAVAAVGLWGVARVHDMLRRPDLATFRIDAPKIALYALPAVLTNIATPFANLYTTAALAGFGDAAVAAWAVIGRINPVAFGAIFALSGAIGPIVGQNLGARAFGRCRTTIVESLKATAVFTALAWLLLAVSAPLIVRIFDVRGETAQLVLLSCRWLAPMFAFLGALFIANAVFNTVGSPHYATAFNWGRATFGTVPFVWIGGGLAGASGVMAGNLLGAIPVGIAAVWVAWTLVGRLERDHAASAAAR